MTAGRLIRAGTAAVVAAVTAFAGIVSYTHIYSLGLAHGQHATAARLLPLSVDGLIVAASLVLLHEARAQRPAPVLARGALWAGIGATVAANALYGAAWGPLGVAVSAWPAAAFVIAAELAFVLVRRAAVRPQEGLTEPAQPDTRMVPQAPGTQPPAAAQRPRRRSVPLEKRSAKVRAGLLADLAAGKAVAELAREHKVSRTGMAAYRGPARRGDCRAGRLQRPCWVTMAAVAAREPAPVP